MVPKERTCYKRMKNRTGGGRRPLELYIHIPFCVRKCLYCDFLSAPSDETVREAYLEALLAEIRGRAEEYRAYSVISLFVGGGTPSVMEGEQLERLLHAVREAYHMEADAEVTVEVNPGTVDAGKLSCYRRAGVNRLSIGLQSANNEELRKIGRIHTWEQFVITWKLARQAGFSNMNVDIMSALPGQTPESYRTTLEKVLALNPPPEHISAYSLIIEEGTPFFERYEKGKLDLPDEDVDRELYHETKRILAKNGYERYEISNYAKEGFACRHNCGYWRRADYVGFGLGAASLVENVRFRNGSVLQAYLENPLACREEIQVLSREEQMEEFMFLGLRLTEGVWAEQFEENFGSKLTDIYGRVIEKNVRDELLSWDGPDEKRLFLTDKGLDLSNYVMAQFLMS